MIQLGNRSGAALRYLWTFSNLGDHPRAGRALDRDRNTLDLELLRSEDWAWSSGEVALIDLAEAISTGNGAGRIAGLRNLDEHHRQVATETLSIWLNGEHEAVTV